MGQTKVTALLIREKEMPFPASPAPPTPALCEHMPHPDHPPQLEINGMGQLEIHMEKNEP